MMERPPVALTVRALVIGTFLAAACLAGALALTLVGVTATAAAVSAVGIVILIATPALGLAATFLETRRTEHRTALMALLVLAILVVAAGVALLTH
jgi:hypothetical protein